MRRASWALLFVSWVPAACGSSAGSNGAMSDGVSADAGPEGSAPDAPSSIEDAATLDREAPSDDADDAAPAIDAPAPDVAPPAEDASCLAVVEQRPLEGATHLPICAQTTYVSNPPSSGNHYGNWAAFATYDFPLRDGFFVHDLEHGAVVITYNCPDGCAADVAAIQAFIDALPEDPACTGFSAKRRIVLTPYPRLTVKFAASAWGWTLRASCFDKGAFGDFVAAHYGHAPEDFCNDGVPVTSTTCP